MRALFAIAATMLACAASPSQQDEAKDRRARVAQAIQAWVDDYARGAVHPGGPLREEGGLQPRYARIARNAELLSQRDGGSLLHVDALQKFLFYAERDADEAIAEAALSVASAGFDKGLVDRDAAAVRELGATSLLRMDNNAVWLVLMRAASGGVVPLLPLNPTSEIAVARRVAALRLLGQKGAPVFRSTIESALGDGDARVRLAAAEAIDLWRRKESLPVLLRALGVESHPVVAQALVRAVQRTLQAHLDAIDAEERSRAVEVAMRRFSRAGWRTDMELLDFVEAFPDRAAVVPLIELLERGGSGDALAETVNAQASPRLRARAYECLRGLTGAILPMEDTKGWRAFWEREQKNIVPPATLPHMRGAVSTRSSFFGIPVEGRNVVFVIDTSGSMDADVAKPDDDERTSSRRRNRTVSRLAAAKQQLVQAVQAMPAESRYRLVTFDRDVKLWSEKPEAPGRASTRALVDLLSGIQAHGGTNVHDALVAALALDGLRFGQEPASEVDEVFVLSDGQPTEGPVRDPEQILEVVRTANRYLHVRIHAVFTGDGAGSEFLRKLAEENDGAFLQR